MQHAPTSSLPVKISKRTEKPIRKYERKAKKNTGEDGSGEGTGSFVGQVTAMLDKMARDAQEEIERGIIGDHIPEDSDKVSSLVEARKHQSKGRGKRRLGPRPQEGVSAGSGNMEGIAKAAVGVTNLDVAARSTSPARQIRRGKGVAEAHTVALTAREAPGVDMRHQPLTMGADVGASSTKPLQPIHVTCKSIGEHFG